MRNDLEILRDRYRGCLLGLAIGDALGAPVEFYSRDQIKSEFGTVTEYHNSPFGKGAWTDDTSMALDIAESYIQFGDCNPDDIIARFLHWYETDGRGIGILIRKVLDLILVGMEPQAAANEAWQRSGRFSAGNGALMRCAPIALARIHDDKKFEWSVLSKTSAIRIAASATTLQNVQHSSG